MPNRHLPHRTRWLRHGDSIERIAGRLYDVHDESGRIDRGRLRRVEEALIEANPGLTDDIHPGSELRIVEVPGLGPFPEIHLDTVEMFREHVPMLCERINRDPALGACFLVDPVQALNDLDCTMSDRLQRRVRAATLGHSRSQSDAYDRVSAEGRLAGFGAITLRPHGRPRRLKDGWSPPDPQRGTNPIGGFDTVLDLSEDVVDGIAKLAYDEGVFPHRVTPAGDGTGVELVIGRPESVSFDTSTAQHVQLILPFAVVSAGTAKSGKLTIEAKVRVVETKGKPAHLTVDPEQPAVVSITSKVLTQQDISMYEMLVKMYLMPHIGKVPLSPVINLIEDKGSSLKLEVVDLDFLIHNIADPKKLDSLAACLNFKPNKGKGTAANVTQFVKSDWAVGTNERLMKQSFSAWWASTEAQTYHRLSRKKLEKFGDLPESQRAEIFDPNGDIHINSVDFSVKNGTIAFSVDVTVEDAFLWIDVDAELTGNISLGVSSTNKLTVSVSNVDSSVSCWSKFLIALLCAFLGILAGGILGGIVGGVVGGIVGLSVGITTGAALGALAGTIVGAVLPAVAEALIQDKLNALQDIELLDLAYDWQIPNSTRTISAKANWITVVPGELLLGGKAVLPTLAKTSISISTKIQNMTETPVTLPWVTAEQLSKSGGPLHYFVSSKTRCSLQAGSGLEKPLACTWKVSGQKLSGQGTAIEIIVTPSLTHTLQPEPSSMLSSGSIQRIPPGKIVPAIQVLQTVRVLQSDGSKGAPLVIRSVVPGPLNTLSTGTPLEVDVTDALDTAMSAKDTFCIQVVGDYVADWWAQNKKKYEAAVPMDDLIGPRGLARPGAGLLVHDDLIGPWRSEQTGQMMNLRSGGIDQAHLALNIDGVKVVEETDLLSHNLVGPRK